MTETHAQPPAGIVGLLGRAALAMAIIAAIGIALTAALKLAGAPDVAVFVASTVTLAVLAGLVGEGTDHLGSHFGAGTTGVLQSALGNLPELFISIFALQQGLVVLTQTSLIGSILGNSLLVLGLAFFAGGLRNGKQVFDAAPVRTIAVVLVLAVAAIAIPTVSTAPSGPDSGHAVEISVFVSVILLVIFAASIPYSLAGGQGASAIGPPKEHAWPLRLAIGVLAASAIGAAVISEWFVDALQPTMAALGWSEAFVGLVVVALAGNAVEHVVGVQQAWKGRTDLAISLIQNSSLQVAIALLPLMVLASLFVSPVPMTLVLSPTLLVGLSLSALLGRVRRVRRRVDLARGPDAPGPVRDHRRLGLVRPAADGLAGSPAIASPGSTSPDS